MYKKLLFILISWGISTYCSDPLEWRTKYYGYSSHLKTIFPSGNQDIFNYLQQYSKFRGYSFTDIGGFLYANGFGENEVLPDGKLLFKKTVILTKEEIQSTILVTVAINTQEKFCGDIYPVCYIINEKRAPKQALPIAIVAGNNNNPVNNQLPEPKNDLAAPSQQTPSSSAIGINNYNNNLAYNNAYDYVVPSKTRRLWNGIRNNKGKSSVLLLSVLGVAGLLWYKFAKKNQDKEKNNK